MQVVNQVGMNMGIQAFALTIARPARQSIRHIPQSWKQAWGEGW